MASIDHDVERMPRYGEVVGHWGVRPAGGGHSTVSLHVEFDIGIPLLAEMLHPVAADALRENAAQMLAALERRLTGADAAAPVGEETGTGTEVIAP